MVSLFPSASNISFPLLAIWLFLISCRHFDLLHHLLQSGMVSYDIELRNVFHCITHGSLFRYLYLHHTDINAGFISFFNQL